MADVSRPLPAPAWLAGGKGNIMTRKELKEKWAKWEDDQYLFAMWAWASMYGVCVIAALIAILWLEFC